MPTLSPSQTPTARWVVPDAAGTLLACLPAYPGSVLLVTALNLGLTPQLPPDVRERLAHKQLCIQVRDARLRFDFTWQGERFVACTTTPQADLTIRANAHDFLRLAQRQEDPDTLFFNRSLSMEGDTELGLMVKNTLDALTLPVLDLRALAPIRLATRLAGWHAAASRPHTGNDRHA